MWVINFMFKLEHFTHTQKKTFFKHFATVMHAFGLLLMIFYKESFRVLTTYDALTLSGVRHEKIKSLVQKTQNPLP